MRYIVFIIILIMMVLPSMAEPVFFTNEVTEISYNLSSSGPFFTGLLVPEHLHNSYYAVQEDSPRIMTVLPSSWDWRDKGGVTPVKDQGNCGACYAFGSLGMIESYVKIDSGTTYDLSEEQAKNCMWEATGCMGGTVQWVMNPFTANGIILEKDFPYKPSNGMCKDIEPTMRITEWRMLSTEKALTVNQLKKYIMEGPVATSLLVDNWERGYNGSYVLSPDKLNKNHSVVLVGWNDGYVKDNKTVPGHWIFKNSWTDEWGDEGFGLIEYGTGRVGTHVSVIGGYEKYNPNVYTLNYDEAGWTGGFGAFGFDTIRGMAVFDNVTGEVTGIEFWTTGATSNINLYLYDGFNDRVDMGKYYLGNLTNELYSIEGLSYSEPGYHSVSIEGVTSTTGTVVVVASIRNIDCVYFDDKRVAPIAIDHKGKKESLKTFVSVGYPNSKWYDWWYDANILPMHDGTTGKADVALRLRVTGDKLKTCEYILLETEGYKRTVDVGNHLQLTYTCIDQYGESVSCGDITWSNSNESVGIMNGSVFEGIVPGNTTIFVKGTCGNPESNYVKITVCPQTKQYLTDNLFKLRMAEIQSQLDELEDHHGDELLDIIEQINQSNGDYAVRMPADAVKFSTFNQMIDDMQEQIDRIQQGNTSLYRLIKDTLNKLFG